MPSAKPAVIVLAALGIYGGRLLAVAALTLLWIVGPHIPGYTMLILLAVTMATVIVEESITHADQRSLAAAS